MKTRSTWTGPLLLLPLLLPPTPAVVPLAGETRRPPPATTAPLRANPRPSSQLTLPQKKVR